MQPPNTARVLLIQPQFVCYEQFMLPCLNTDIYFVSFTLFFVTNITCLHFIYLLHFNINYGLTHHARVSRSTTYGRSHCFFTVPL